MALQNMLVYRINSGDSTYPHYGNFGIEIAGSITIDDSNGSRDWEFGDDTHTGGSDVPDQDVTQSSVAGISIGDTVDSRYQYTFTGSDGSSGNIYFLATNEANNYGPLIVSDTPLDPSVTYRFRVFDTDGAVPYNNLVTCFTTGTMIETAGGAIPVEALSTGDLVQTLDDGLQPIRWIGLRRLDAIDLAQNTKLRPVRIAAGALGNDKPERDLVVSPQHRVLVRSRIAERMFDNDETLVPAGKLVGLEGISVDDQADEVTYFHILFDRHQIVFSEGAATESLFLGEEALKAVSADARAEIAALFPDVLDPGFAPEPARPIPPSGRLMRKLVARHARNQHPVQ